MAGLLAFEDQPPHIADLPDWRAAALACLEGRCFAWVRRHAGQDWLMGFAPTIRPGTVRLILMSGQRVEVTDETWTVEGPCPSG